VSHMTETLHGIMDATRAQDNERFLGYLAEDIEYHYHVGSPPVRGIDGVRRFLAKYRTIADEVIWRIDRTAEADGCLLVEGYEEYLDKRTGDRVAHPYMGILEFRADGKITKWRDYFEMNNKLK
jgi:limonene-1,2-epoxide hydrolase